MKNADELAHSRTEQALLDAAIVAMMRAWKGQEYFGEAQQWACLQLCICDIANGERIADIDWWDANITRKRRE